MTQQPPLSPPPPPQPSGKYYVSITGLRLQSVWHYLTFARHAVPCYRTAQSTPGNVFTGSRYIDGVQHTVTAWESREAAMRFVVTSVHRQAIQAFASIATATTYGYWTDEIPTWDQAIALWKEHGVDYEKKKQQQHPEAEETISAATDNAANE